MTIVSRVIYYLIIEHYNCIIYFDLFGKDETLVVPIEQRDVVRDYIEKLVSSMVDTDAGSLDCVPIGQLSTNRHCK